MKGRVNGYLTNKVRNERQPHALPSPIRPVSTWLAAKVRGVESIQAMCRLVMQCICAVHSP